MVFMQTLTFKEEAAIPTCNLLETIHNKWMQASRSKMVDLYHATLDDYSRAALQSIGYHNYLKCCGGGSGPRRSVLQLKLTSRSRNSSRVVKLVDELR